MIIHSNKTVLSIIPNHLNPNHHSGLDEESTEQGSRHAKLLQMRQHYPARFRESLCERSRYRSGTTSMRQLTASPKP